MPDPIDEAAVAIGRMFAGEIAAGVNPEHAVKRVKWALGAEERDLAEPRLDPVLAEKIAYVQIAARDAASARYEAEMAIGQSWGTPITASMWPKPPGEVMRFAGATLRNGRNAIVARKKVGKTTAMHSVISSYLTGSSLFGHYPMSEPFGRRVLLMNFELPDPYEWEELHRGGLLVHDDLDVWNLRGRQNPLASDRGRRELQARLGEDIGMVALDPLSGATRGILKSDNDNAMARQWTGMLDEVVGMEREVWLPAHAGHGSETQIRGASEFEGWLDCQFAVTKDEAGNRHLWLDGRGVDDPREGDEAYGVDFDDVSHRVTIDIGRTRGMTRKSAGGAPLAATLKASIRVAHLRDLTLTVVEDNPGILKGPLEAHVGGKAVEAREALAQLLRAKEIVQLPSGRGLAHWIAGTEPLT